jgi:hypothetical protein
MWASFLPLQDKAVTAHLFMHKRIFLQAAAGRIYCGSASAADRANALAASTCEAFSARCW